MEAQMLRPSSKPLVKSTNPKNEAIVKAFYNIIAEVHIAISKLPSVQARRDSYTNNTDNPLKPRTQLEFVCLFGTVAVILKNGTYQLEIETDLNSEFGLNRKDYLRLLRTAFKFTMFENTSENIEDLLTIDCSNSNHYDYFKKKVTEPDGVRSFTAVQQPLS